MASIQAGEREGSQEEGKRHVRNVKEIKSAGLWEEKGRNQS